eukprot:scaffold32639_cov112-Isochrysis_galbana.AAC.3
MANRSAVTKRAHAAILAPRWKCAHAYGQGAMHAAYSLLNVRVDDAELRVARHRQATSYEKHLEHAGRASSGLGVARIGLDCAERERMLRALGKHRRHQ